MSWCFHLVKTFIILWHSLCHKTQQCAAGFNSYLLLVMGMLSCTAVHVETCLHFLSGSCQVYFKVMINSFKDTSEFYSKGSKDASPLVLNWRLEQQQQKTPPKPPMTTIRLILHGELLIPRDLLLKSNDFQGKCNGCSLSVSSHAKTEPHAASSSPGYHQRKLMFALQEQHGVTLLEKSQASGF